jgi:hypothetical protein
VVLSFAREAYEAERFTGDLAAATRAATRVEVG